jgi:hypothetical protein
MRCQFCDSTNIRTSRWQAQDFFMLPLLMVPVRCHDCIKRTYRNLFLILWAQAEKREGRG